MADFDISTPVKFINRHGIICAGIVVEVISDDRASLVWFDPSNQGIQSYVHGVLYSNDVVASSTFHLATSDLTPKTDDEKASFRLNAVESSGLETMTVAPGSGQTIQPIAGVPLDQQVMPTDGKVAEKAMDAMQVPPTTPVIVTDPPEKDRAGIPTPSSKGGTVTPPVDPAQPKPAEPNEAPKEEDATFSA